MLDILIPWVYKDDRYKNKKLQNRHILIHVADLYCGLSKGNSISDDRLNCYIVDNNFLCQQQIVMIP